MVKQLGCGSSERVHPHKVKDFISLKGFEQPKSSHTSQQDGPNHNPSHKIKTFADIKCLLSERSLLTDSYLNIIIVLPAFSSSPDTNSDILSKISLLRRYVLGAFKNTFRVKRLKILWCRVFPAP